jgi:hypothetical protein
MSTVPEPVAGDAEVYGLALDSARGRLDAQMSGLKELRDRTAVVVSVAGALGTLTIAILGAADRTSTEPGGAEVLSAVTAGLALLAVFIAAAVVWSPFRTQWFLDGRQQTLWGDRGFDLAMMRRESALQLATLAEVNVAQLEFRYQWFVVGVVALAIEILSLATFTWSVLT